MEGIRWSESYSHLLFPSSTASCFLSSIQQLESVNSNIQLRMSSPIYLGVVGKLTLSIPLYKLTPLYLSYTFPTPVLSGSILINTRRRRRRHRIPQTARFPPLSPPTDPPRPLNPNPPLPGALLHPRHPSSRVDRSLVNSLPHQIRRIKPRANRRSSRGCPRPLNPSRQHLRPCSRIQLPALPKEGHFGRDA